jgi:hypothetical protein
MYASVNGGIECCSCKFAPKVKSVFTEGTKNHPIFKDMSPCKQCGGKGCDACMLHTNMTLKTYEDALEHLQKHKDSGDDVPEYAFEGLREDMKRGEPLEPLYCACGKIAMVFSFDGKPPRCIECASKDEKENK